MTCQHCGAALPPIAMFCGECGRSVTAAAPPVVNRPVLPAAAPSAVPADIPWSVDAPLSISPASPAAPPAFDWSAVPDDAAPDDAVPAVAPAEEAPAPVVEGAVSSCGECGTPAEPGDAFCGECGSPLVAETRVIERIIVAEPAVAPAAAAKPEPEPQPEPPLQAPAAPALAPAPAPAADLEQTRLVPRGTGGARFVLQFSTGESYTVLGSGLAGRNPQPEPSEVVDHLVTIVDPGRSVSKTHLEFGQEAGVFWVSDRHSGNGSVIREPGEPPRPCEPGRRYVVMRGTRIDMGEQFVIVS